MNDLPRRFRTAHQIFAAGLTGHRDAYAIARVGERYAVAITPEMAALIDPADPQDPIARQFVPDVRELEHDAREISDPIADQPNSPVKGLVHRYRDRVLLKIASVCPVYCRFCFRREMVGPNLGEAMTRGDIVAALAYVRAHDEVREVIMTGGDPFVLAPMKVAEITHALGEIDHIEIIRWHTRVPVVDPERVTEALVQALNASQKLAVVAIHTNHPRELTQSARGAIRRLGDAGIPLLSQTVLLKGVNDDAATLETLMRAVAELGVRPYYLHHGDLAPGTAHFRTTLADGIELMRTLRATLPPQMMPRYVLDIPGGFGKVDIETNVQRLAEGTYTVRDANGREHTYTDVVTA